MRLLLELSYKGTNYQGWQRQPNVLSVQQVIEETLSQYFNQPISIYGSGRTDSGVHALRQFAHFDVNKDEVNIDKMIYSLNLMLPKDIKINNIELVEDDFHARFSATSKSYAYSITLANKDVFSGDLSYVCPFPLDVEKMKEVLSHFEGRHNFKNFTSKEEDKDNFVRDIYEIHFEQQQNFINITLTGDGFMRYMVRYIIGTAIEVARNRISIDEVDMLLDENSKRHIVSYKAPAEGLMLMNVTY